MANRVILPHVQKAIALATLTETVTSVAKRYGVSRVTVNNYRKNLRDGRYRHVHAAGAESVGAIAS